MSAVLVVLITINEVLSRVGRITSWAEAAIKLSKINLVKEF